MEKRTLKKSLMHDFMKGTGNKWRWIINNIKVEGNKEQRTARRKLHEKICDASKSEYKEGGINDIGTTLYLIGAIDEEKYVDPIGESDFILDQLDRTQKPLIGGVIVKKSRRGNISRMGLITLIDPLRITTRRKEGRKLKVDMIPSLVGFRLAKKAHLIEYYIPKV